MNFTDKSFLPFILIVYLLWLYCRHNYRLSLIALLGASLVAYAIHKWEMLFLILGYCVFAWALGLWLARTRRPGLVLAGGVIVNLVVLAYWKYTPLLIRTAINVAFALDLPTSLEVPRDWLLPWGISFYTFTSIAYLVDIYRKDIAPETNLVRYTLFITFFPHLVAGPILRARDFLTSLQPESMPQYPSALPEAALLLGRGFFKKLVLADRLSQAIDPFFAHVTDASTAGVWSLPYVYLYALQIYFDFSAYTDIARGIGLMFGFRWPENFNLPYLAGSVADFWKRWHMTLSQFLRDYLYIPLGGNRGGAWRTSCNLLATMLLGGLWHGASWSFLIWGGLHGSFLVVHRLWSGSNLRALIMPQAGWSAVVYRVVMTIVTFHFVCLAWCFFRLTDLSASWICVQKWVLFDSDKVWVGNAVEPSLLVALAGYGLLAWVGHLLHGACQRRDLSEVFAVSPLRTGVVCGFSAALLLPALLLSPGGEAPAFIYFQF